MAVLVSVVLSTLQEIQERIGSLSGKSLVVHHFATWCAPCVEEMPVLVQMARELEGRVHFLAISWDLFMTSADPSRESVAAFADELGLPFDVLVYTGSPDAIFQAFEISSGTVPYTMVFDAAGKVVYRLDGALQGAETVAELRRRAAPSADYTLVEVTADVGIEVTSDGPECLFEKAADAFNDVMFGLDTIEPRDKSTLAAEAIDLPGLLVAFLSELLYLFEVESRIFRRVEVKSLTDSTIYAEAWGERFDPDRHAVREAVKAVTYHQLRVEEQDDRWTARVIFDL